MNPVTITIENNTDKITVSLTANTRTNINVNFDFSQVKDTKNTHWLLGEAFTAVVNGINSLKANDEEEE